MLPYILFAIASLVYLIASFLAVRSSLVNGHRGDFTLPVTVAFVGISVLLWGVSFLLLGSIHFTTLFK